MNEKQIPEELNLLISQLLSPPPRPPKPKKKCGRLRKPKRPKKKPGRKRFRRTFDETKIGSYLKSEAPLEYSLILKAGGEVKPSANLIEAIGYASLSPIFKTTKFRRSLIEYRKYGLCCGRPAKEKSSITQRVYKTLCNIL